MNDFDQNDQESLGEPGNEMYGHPPRETGHVKWFDERKRYGFIRREDGRDVFVHASNINRQPPTLRENERVEFTVVPGTKGPAAENVTVLLELPR
jgi:CspA family cold shock protein